mmetsp:Transcript_73418/g.185436  ORF Transcript_73418/g.185436 Transcript_73418/m.185436 type:complete len:264 (-) Transcript_73418:7-798(-)
MPPRSPGTYCCCPSRFGLGHNVVSSWMASRMNSMNSSESKLPPPSSSMALKAMTKLRSGASWSFTSRTLRKNRRISSGPRLLSPPAVSMIPSFSAFWKRCSSSASVKRCRCMASLTTRLTCFNTSSFILLFFSFVRMKDKNSVNSTSPPPSSSIARKNSQICSSETNLSAILRCFRAMPITSLMDRVPDPLVSQAMNSFLKNSVSFLSFSFGESWPLQDDRFDANISKDRTRLMVFIRVSSASILQLATKAAQGKRSLLCLQT